MKKRIVSLLVLAMSATMLAGCSGQAEIEQLNNLESLNSDSSVSKDYNLSWTDEQSMIYAQVSARKLLDLSTLDSLTDNESQQVINYMNSVDTQLTGTLPSNTDDVIDERFTNYLLSEFARTPYYWQREKMIIRGIDPSSRSVILDVVYKTIDFEKEVALDSTIVLGEPNYQKKLENRCNKWLALLNRRLDMEAADPTLVLMENQFKEYYGDPEYILEEQRELSLTDDIFETGNQRTYSGLIDTDEEQGSAHMTVRYVLVPKYTLGINLGLECKHLYVYDYSLDNDFTSDMDTFSDEGYATVTDNLYSLIYSYFQCIDESDYNGLYKLTYDFETQDKYWKDRFDTSYGKHEGFSVSLFDITGTHIKCGVTVSSKNRPKGSNITFPIYTDRYYMELELVDGALCVNNMVLLSRVIEGEPAIQSFDADLSGFTANITLSNDDKIAIENLICDFSALQLNKDTTSDKFSDVVDISIPNSQLAAVKTNMTALSGVRKVVWLRNYQQGNDSYALVKCKELFQDDKNVIVEADANYEFMRVGGKWLIYNYDINSSVKIDTTNLSTTGSLCLVSPGKVDSYSSQVKSTVSTSDVEASDISVTIDYAEYTPQLKEGSAEQGINVLRVSNLDSDMFKEIVDLYQIEIPYSYDELINLRSLNVSALEDAGFGEVGAAYSDMIDILLEYIVNFANLSDSRVDATQFNLIAGSLQERAESDMNTMRVIDEHDNADLFTKIEELQEMVRSCMSKSRS